MPTLTDEIHDVENQILNLREKLAQLRAKLEEKVEDYELEEWNGPTVLSELFQEKQDLLVIHNMGAGCRFCTLWADGLNGLYDHLSNRAAVALVTPDEIDSAMQFAEGRHWRFHIVSDPNRTFSERMGYWNPVEKSAYPGVSAFRKLEDGTIIRTGTASFGEHDDFCAIWHLFGLLKDGVNGWEPQYHYMG